MLYLNFISYISAIELSNLNNSFEMSNLISELLIVRSILLMDTTPTLYQ